MCENYRRAAEDSSGNPIFDAVPVGMRLEDLK
jgi:hypothetical protein